MTIQDNTLSLSYCSVEKCNKEVKKRRTIRDEWLKKSRINYDNYINKYITKKEFNKIKTELNDNYYNSNEINDIHKCELAKCSKFVKKKLDYIAAKINYVAKDKTYTLDDYIRILKLSTKITPDISFDLSKCSKETENNRTNSSLYLKNLNKYYDLYINKKINYDVFSEKINKIVHDYYNSNQVKSLFKCELDNYYSNIKKKLDYMAVYIHYDIKDKYSLDDYILILTISEKILNYCFF